MEYLKIAENFARNIWKSKENIKLVDLMLFGSLVHKKNTPHDIDLLIIHENPLLDRFQFEYVDLKIDIIRKLYSLQKLLGKEINLEKIINNTGTEELIKKNLFNTKYMNFSFFEDENYKNLWIENNKKYHDISIKKNRIGNETFEECIFRQGLLWNPKLEKYCIPARNKYKI